MNHRVTVGAIFANSENGTAEAPSPRGFAALVEAGVPVWNYWRRQTPAALEAAVDFSGVTFERAVDFNLIGNLGSPCFVEASFPEGTTFRGVQFAGRCNFSGARFHGRIDFEGCHFHSCSHFVGTHFEKEAAFRSCTFEGSAQFQGTTFDSLVDFTAAKFIGQVEFTNVKFANQEVSATAQTCLFAQAEFSSVAYFRSLRFPRATQFRKAMFRDGVSFEGVEFCQSVNFEQVRITGEASEFSAPVEFPKQTNFSRAVLSNLELKEAKFGEGANFNGSKLSRVSFTNTTFGPNATFKDADFEEFAEFEGAKFGPQANFEEANFKSQLDFRDAQFDDVTLACRESTRSEIQGADFAGATFRGRAEFLGRKFRVYASFDHISRGPTTFNVSPSFHHCELPAENNIAKANFRDWVSPGASEDYRVLKQLMGQLGASQEKLQFSRLEMHAELAQEPSWRVGVLYRLYLCTSNFGESVWRPICWWVGFSLLALSGYGLSAGLEWADLASLKSTQGWDTTSDLIVHTLLRSLPLSGNDKLADQIWHELTPATARNYSCLGLVQGIHKLASVYFAFLVGLALRNRFRIS